MFQGQRGERVENNFLTKSQMDETYKDLEKNILLLDPKKHDCKLQIAVLRKKMDRACDQGKITLPQWRGLLLEIGQVKAQCNGEELFRW